MQFLAPLALLLGLLALVVLAFHIRRRRTLPVPSLVIWRQLSAGQVKRNRVWQWPNPSWALALQLLAVLAMAFALAQPLIRSGETVDHWIFVLDRSGPMEANAGGQSLLEAAEAQVADRIGSGAGGMVSILTVGTAAQPLLVRQRMDDPGLGEALDAIAPQDAPADFSGLDALAGQVTRPGEKTRMVIFSDRDLALAPPTNADLTAETVILVPDSGNAALTAQIAADPKVANKWTLTGTVRLDAGMAGTELVVGYASDPSEQPLEWTRRAIGDAEPATEPSERKFSVPLNLPGPGIVSVSIADDANGYDNAARFALRSAAPTLDVLYIGAGNQPLLNAIKAIDGTAIFQAPGLPADVSQYGLVVVDNQHVARQPETNVVWIGDAGVGGSALETGGSQSATGAATDHPLMRDIAWSTIAARDSFTLTPDGETQTLLRAGDRPLITLRQSEHGRDIALGFDPRSSTWAGQPGLPIFAANLVGWLGLSPQLPTACTVGEACALDRRFEGGTVAMIGQASEPVRDANWVPQRAGLYEFSHGARSLVVAVNPMIATARNATDAAGAAEAVWRLWPWLIGVALLALIAEAVISGRGAERFLRAEGLRASSPLSTRRRVTLGLRLAGLALAIAALVNVPLPYRQSGETLLQVLAPGGAAKPDMTAIADGVDYAGDTANAIALAAATVPWGEPGHLLVSGATASDGDALARLGATLAQRDIVLDVAEAVVPSDPLLVAALEAPEPVFAGDTFQLSGVVHASADAPATLRFTRNGETLVEQPVALVAGDNRVDTIISDVEADSAVYGLSVQSPGDSAVANNKLTRVITPGTAGAIAVIANDPARAQTFASWLESQGATPTLIEPKAVPYRPDDWKAYDGAVLLDVPAIALTTLQQEQIENAVADQGMGLLILGGPNSFGPGGYLETPLERASPLSSKVPRDAPEATLVFVLDRSGSMQQPVGNGTRLDIAKQATLAAIRLLNRNSQVGVIVFDSDPTTVLPLGRIDNPDVVTEALSNVDPGGGTSVYPGLQAAFDMLRNVETPARHIIVMTDGLSQPADFPGLLAEIRNAGITVSSVSIGQGAERTLIEQIARLGGGSFHATDDFAALPSILSQEAMLLSGSPIETGTTQPLWASRDEPFLRGLPATMPPIDAFVLTTAKPEAQLSMVVPDNKGEPMPLLASWRFGAGQVLALTTEAVGPWSANWQALEGYPALWAQALRQFLPGVERGDAVLDGVRRGDGFALDLLLRGDAAGAVPTLTVTGADGVATPLPVTKASADSFGATYYPGAAGTYRFAASAGDVTAERSVTLDYPAYMGRPAPDHALRQLAIASGGAVDVTTPQLRNLSDRWSLRPFWPLWLALALAVLMAELTVRYTRLLAPRALPRADVPPSPNTATRAASRDPLPVS